MAAAVAGALVWLSCGVPAHGAEAADDGYYDDPALDGFADDPAYGEPTDDPFYGDPCDPANHPDWESDPYCNPGLLEAGDFSDPRFDAGSALSTGDRADPADMPSVTELDMDEAVTVVTSRMLLAIDALSELGAFERADRPETVALIRDVRDSIPAAGLSSSDYVAELEQFVTDVVPFLDLLEATGVVVSDDLWIAVDDLEFIGLAPGGLDDGATAFLPPEPWINGVGDLLLRGGETAAVRTGDPDAIRFALTQFGVGDESTGPNVPTADSDTETTTTTLPTPAAVDAATVDEPGSPDLPVLPIGAVLVAAASVAAVLWRRRSPGTTPSGPVVAVDHRSGPDNGAPGVDAPTPSVTDLLDASRRMTSSLDVASIADIALAEARRLVDAEGGIVCRRSADGLDPISCEPPMLFNYDHIADGCLPRVIDTGRSTTSIATDEPLLVEVPMAMAAVPIVADGVVSGAILVVRVSARPFARDELDSLEMLAPLVGSAFAAADTHESATELADVEPLTGLQNRRRLDLDLASISADEQVAYVMVDIDHFKNFNDTNGHAAGDEALRQVSAILSTAVRPRDLVYRYGGEEFCVLLPGATAAEAAEVAERARAAVEAAHIPGMENQPEGRVTISVGVSDSAWGAPTDLVERADAALYEAKRNGRNQVSLHQG